MKITIIAVGSNIPIWVDNVWHDYAKRLQKNYKIDLKEIKSEDRKSNQNIKKIILNEAKKISLAIPKNSLIIALDEHGEDFSTQKLTEFIIKSSEYPITFIIGGADGLDDSIRKTCHKMIKLSSLTFPHHIVRILLIEQIYRCWSIINKHPYHRI
ncbi:SPOUT methyltransferase superfamily protein [Candidatus Kinetoplastibacterium desouzaii TCC079E]|uniref:Ribosomal RNA large subunit methyltransferase H n=1 Tax=Candidatus Kinetoplastidibacterium desouzai TCC079E TaxID=1208919 RepID=M1M3E3_9PROT|nr:23S rRNA (pseudouridine(1915)-N(3))-methyltransferase RlmH [Candidatus Kinetoplastibacterium desouzaii]AGF46755.1 SPOUT methyltransferase superfamily protein [Candidatus Kinetoplastibacterium desouzaii TCC079E]